MLLLPEPTGDTPTMAHVREAFAALTPSRTPRWGSMNAAQMTRHCRRFVELCLGGVPVGWPVRLVARMIGPMMLRWLMRRSPVATPKNLRTLAPLRTRPTDELDLDDERRRLFAALDELATAPDPLRHPLYGAMARRSVEAVVRHHSAHHLNQFGLLDHGGPTDGSGSPD